MKNTAGGSVKGEMGPNIFFPGIPAPLYTTVSIDYLFACTPDYRLFWTRWDGSRDKNIFGAAEVQSRRHCTPRLLSSAYYCIRRLPFCLYPQAPFSPLCILLIELVSENFTTFYCLRVNMKEYKTVFACR